MKQRPCGDLIKFISVSLHNKGAMGSGLVQEHRDEMVSKRWNSRSNSLIIGICPAASSWRHVVMFPSCKIIHFDAWLLTYYQLGPWKQTTAYPPSYPGYFREPHWKSMGLPEISRVTWWICFSEIRIKIHKFSIRKIHWKMTAIYFPSLYCCDFADSIMDLYVDLNFTGVCFWGSTWQGIVIAALV